MSTAQIIVLMGLAIAIIVVEIIQWLKNGPTSKAPPWVWWAALPVLCLGLALASIPLLGALTGVVLPLLSFIIIGAVGWALGQAGYEIIVKQVPAILQAIAEHLKAMASLNNQAVEIQAPRAVPTPPPLTGQAP